MATIEPFDPESIRRFAQSSDERKLVSDKLRQGVKPYEIDSKSRVERRKASLQEVVSETIAAIGPETTLAGRDRDFVLERVIRHNDLLSTRYFLQGANTARSVCRIRLDDRGIGTGFLVTPNLLLTNHHVIRDQQDAFSMNAEFDYELDLDGTMKSSIVFDFDPKTFFLTSDRRKLDYTLIAVKPKSRNGKVKLANYGFIPLVATTGKILRGESTNIVQHPSGEPKQIAIQNSHLIALLKNHLHYEADTMPGSSGSPVFNNQWVVIGLHHSGVPKTNQSGQPLDKNGRLWDGINDDDISWIGNEGIRISRIIADVWSQARSNQLDHLLTEFPEAIPSPTTDDDFETHVTDTSDLTSPFNSSPVREQMKDSTITTHVNSTQGNRGGSSITLTIPLNITVSFGGADGLATSNIDIPQLPLAPVKPAEPEADIDELVRLGKKLFDEARSRTYYDEVRDTTEISRYYNGIRTDANNFKSSLETLIRTTHTKPKPYKTARVQFLYSWVDLRRNLKVRSIYSNIEYSPSRFIDDDLVIERRRDERLEKFKSQELYSESHLESFLDALEASDPFNCEHVVPQSWFGEKEPHRGDLHHLFACETNCNSFRSNHPYEDHGKFEISDEGINRPQCGFLESGEFEPFRGKAKVARATLYFAMRYPGQFNRTGKAYNSQKLKLLVEWCEAVPPDEHEKHRNQAIQEIQGNRNPFIDHPEWARLVFAS